MKNPIQRCLRGLHQLLRKIERTSIVRGKHIETKHHRVKLGGNIPHGEEVPKGLRHLLIVYVDKSIVHPIVCEALAMRRFILCNFIFMMRENEVLAAGMNVQLSSTVLRCHNATLRVPARSSFTPRRIPVRFSHLFRLPEHEIGGTLLLFLSGNLQLPKTGTKLVHVLVGKLSVSGKSARIIIYRSVHRISKALLHQSINEGNHPSDFFRSLRMRCRFLNIQILHILFHFGNIALRYGRAIHAFLRCRLDNLIIYIRIVGNVTNIISFVFHKTAEGIKNNHRTGIPDMNQIVNGRSADIHSDFSLLNRDELFLLFRHGVIDFHTALSSFPTTLSKVYSLAFFSSRNGKRAIKRTYLLYSLKKSWKLLNGSFSVLSRSLPLFPLSSSC